MGIEITKRADIKGVLTKRLEGIEKNFTTAISDETTRLVADTEQGKGYKGTFKAYSPEYAKFRVKKGRGTTPNLRLGVKTSKSSPPPGMMKAFTYKVRREANRLVAEIGIFDQAQKAKALGNNALRPFLGFSREALARIKAAIFK